jgi:hypothetical protein
MGAVIDAGKVKGGVGGGMGGARAVGGAAGGSHLFTHLSIIRFSFILPFPPFLLGFFSALPFPSFLFTFVFVAVFRLLWISSLAYPSLLGTKRFDCCMVFPECTM